jgi:hypothetical protein
MRKPDNNTKRKVYFDHKVRVKRVPRICEYSQEQIQKMWVQPLEQGIGREHFKQTIFKVMKGDLLVDTDEYCIRGTEIGIPGYIEPRRHLILNATRAIIKEHNRQRQEERLDPELLRAVYLQFSLQSSAEGYNQGLQDAIDAKKVLEFYSPRGSALSSNFVGRFRPLRMLQSREGDGPKTPASESTRRKGNKLVSFYKMVTPGGAKKKASCQETFFLTPSSRTRLVNI